MTVPVDSKVRIFVVRELSIEVGGDFIHGDATLSQSTLLQVEADDVQREYVVGEGWRQASVGEASQQFHTNQVTPFVEQSYPLDHVADGLEYLASSHVRGKLVVTI